METLHESLSAAPEVLRLFPAFVWKAQLRPEVHQPLDAAILRELDELMRAAGAPGPGETWQSDHGLHRREPFHGLARVIDGAVRTVLAFLKVGHDAFEITGCWASVAPRGGTIRMHSHPNNYLSGVYYVRVQPGADTINFHEPRPQAGVIRPPVAELTAYNTDQVVVQVARGTLLVFPAWLPHSVDPNASDALRASISFNIMFNGFAQLAKPLWGDE